MLTADQFTRDLEYGFRALSHNRTNIPKNILTVYRALFADFFPLATDAEAAYRQLLSCSIKSLDALTPFLTPTTATFQTAAQLTYSQWKSITEPLKSASVSTLPVDFKRLYPVFFAEEYKPRSPADDADEQAWKRYWAQDERWAKSEAKASSEAADETPENERPFMLTLLWPYRHQLIAAVPGIIPLEIPSHSWFEGCWIVAPPGRGKTNLLRHLLLNIPQPDDTIIILDAKGDLINSFNRLRRFASALVYLEPDEDFPLAINPLSMGQQSIEFLEYIFSALLETPLTPLQATLFRLTLTLCVTIPNATLETFRDIIQNGWKKYDADVKKLRPRDQDFFLKEFDTETYRKTKQEVMWRLRTLMSIPSLDAIFQSPTTKLDLGKLMDGGTVICINNNYDLLGEQGSEFFARLFIALIWAAARKRSRLPDDQKKPVYVFIDEAHFAIARDKKIATILQQCRAQKIAMIFAHQEVQQIKDEDVKSALTNCAIKFANSTGEAYELAGRLDTTPEFLKAQKRGQFALYVRDTTDTAVSLNVPLVDMRQHPKITEAEYQTILTECRESLCYTYTEQTYSTTEEAPPQQDGTLYWKRTLSPKLALKGGLHNVPVTGNDGLPKTLKVVIKPGTKHGDKVRLKGYGTPRRDGRGDIIIEWIIPQRADKAEQAAKEPQYKPTGISPPEREERW